MKYCKKPFFGIYCMPNGDIGLCGWTDAVVGNILEDDLEDIWNGKLAQEVRNSIKDGSYQYCRKVSCPDCENNTLPDITAEELEAMEPEVLPTYYEIANDIICNHSCPSCRDHVFTVDEEYNEKLKKGLNKLLPYFNKAERISVNGAGELFASPIMMNMMRQLRPENPNFRIGIQTNGALFNEKNWKKIEHLGQYYITVTVTPNSFDRYTHAYLCGGHKSYDHVIHNLYFMKELRQKNLINSLRVSIVVQDRNFMELPSFVDRCLNDFEADEVVVKPLYKWFYMSEELYWFKDILNPNHPYHKEYMEILKNPILDNPKVFLWGGRNLHEARPHPAYKYKNLLAMATKLMLIPDVEKKLSEIIKGKGKNEVILYGDNDLSNIIVGILKKTDIKVKCILARDTNCECQGDINIAKLNDYTPSDDLILISNYYDRKFIERDLSLKMFKGQIMDIKEVLDAIGL